MNDPEPTYQGRELPRPQDELVDQGPGFDPGTLLNRRSTLRLLGLGAAGAALTACGTGSGGSTSSTATPSSTTSTSAASGEIPEESAGPYPGDGSNGPDVRVVESFLTLPSFIVGTNRITLTQAKPAPLLTAAGGVRAVPCPYETVPLVEALWWHPTHDSDPEHVWLRSIFAEAGEQLSGTVG
ncbi:hypothetical protein CDG81_12565 [Actinopolyspora erythraea]|uniref:Uncharacterized protein n=1 Tax=Actinopolyspora erythraea TaxID=414996 RepID=A0A099D4M2_9ACTN|nr:hypothetical protein [Actinopolyspora erythraea]ASU78981.1 hypothetical protein CDG81_12565 [Actinopolyspora erythraea]KGI81108.1 hypothetical protein IL38_12650 [Actinopolyspora erythraea]